MESIKHQTERVRQKQFEAMIAHFLEKWQPEDREKAIEFNADMYCVMRNLFMDVQRPVQESIQAVMSGTVYNGPFKRK